MRNLKLTVAYDGGAYHGFQRQRDESLPTIQGMLESGWSRLVGERVKVIGAGRTDAGVHADGQVVNFRTESRAIPAARVPYAMNSVLPRDIRVIGCEEAPFDFHAQYDALSKRYVYRMLNLPFPLPRFRHDTYFVPKPLDTEAMNRAAQALVGRHDFAAFTEVRQVAGSTVRHMFRCAVEREGGIVKVIVEADGFLYHMVRAIAGTLLKVGDGSQPPAWVEEVLQSGDRRLAGPTLPGKGLVLESIKYP